MRKTKSTHHTPHAIEAKHTHQTSPASHEAQEQASPSFQAMAKLEKPAWYKTQAGKITVFAITAVILIAGATWYSYVASRSRIEAAPQASSASATPSESPKPVTAESALTGMLVTPELATKPVMSVVIENLFPDARPQSGLSQAGVVYEALAEGGITRYIAFYQTDIPTDIGPVRSLRPVFYQMGTEYNAPVAHIGGSTDGLALAQNDRNFKDMDQFYNGAYFRRITARWAPHNVYIYGDSLKKMVQDKGWYTPPTFAAWKRKDDSPSASPNATRITADFSYADYTASFQYDAPSNSYMRSVGAKPDLDAANGQKQVAPKTVIVLYAATTYGTQPNGKPKTDINLIGNGKAVLFQDGIATECTWKKASDKGRLTLTDTSGNEVALNRGQSWVSIVPAGRPVIWQ